MIKIVAMAASAGGLAALIDVLGGLAREFPVPILIVQHLDPHHPTLMPSILARYTPLHVKEARSGEHILAGTVYLAPPDEHLLVDKEGLLSLGHTKLVKFVRPSADVLFESVASAYGPEAIAVVLTGTGSDGADGVRAIKKAGGVVIAQDQPSSKFFAMPEAAILTGDVDYILPLSDIADRLRKLVSEKRDP